mmetsp:Transcript_101443/g.124193  ORF Transcript_101443/g.124193 Transcript_101443/m.124193 type:complete len:213 (+) Transcript_101443:68-706(+)
MICKSNPSLEIWIHDISSFMRNKIFDNMLNKFDDIINLNLMEMNKFCNTKFDRINLNDIRHEIPKFIRQSCKNIFNNKGNDNINYNRFKNNYLLWYYGSQTKHIISIVKHALVKVEKVLLKTSQSFDAFKQKVYYHLGFFGMLYDLLSFISNDMQIPLLYDVNFQDYLEKKGILSIKLLKHIPNIYNELDNYTMNFLKERILVYQNVYKTNT